MMSDDDDDDDDEKDSTGNGTSVHVSLGDIHHKIISVSAVCVLTFIVLYCALYIMRDRWSKRKGHDVVRITKKEYIHIIGAVALVNFVMVTVIFIYMVTHTIINWDEIYQCQLALILLVSWCSVFFLIVADFGLSVIPTSFSPFKRKPPGIYKSGIK